MCSVVACCSTGLCWVGQYDGFTRSWKLWEKFTLFRIHVLQGQNEPNVLHCIESASEVRNIVFLLITWLIWPTCTFSTRLTGMMKKTKPPKTRNYFYRALPCDPVDSSNHEYFVESLFKRLQPLNMWVSCGSCEAHWTYQTNGSLCQGCKAFISPVVLVILSHK